jgi:hypothetical protein
MFGAQRSIAFRMRAKREPDPRLTCTWLIPAMWYSTGSSAVMILTSGRFSSLSARVERRRLARSRRPRDEDDPFGRLMMRRNQR